MIPIHDNVRSRVFPFVNVAIIIVNIVVFLYEVALSQQVISGTCTELDRFIGEWGNVPAYTLNALGFDQATAGRGIAVCRGFAVRQQPEPVATLITSMFLHGGWLHLIGNMLFLYIFGDNVEDSMGHVRYAIFYAVAGVAASFAQMLTDTESLVPAIGASGAVAGVMGAYIVLHPRATVQVLVPFFFFIPFAVPAVLLIGVWFLMQLFYGAAALDVEAKGAEGGVAYFAHIGGFVAGLLLVHLFTLGRQRRRTPRTAIW